MREINLQAHVPRAAVSLQPSFEVVVTAYYNRGKRRPARFARLPGSRITPPNVM